MGTISPVSSRDGNKLVGRHHAQAGVLPAQQYFKAFDSESIQGHDGLVITATVPDIRALAAGHCSGSCALPL